jgi:hypothetical protein
MLANFLKVVPEHLHVLQELQAGVLFSSLKAQEGISTAVMTDKP